MTIRILSPELANQIAAGEVVERPASILKELVENSIDAGATQIKIELEQGGCKRLFIQDDGVGIPKEELSLALARHATSKINNLDDLESIGSLGFRGEALASISSVSRLTLHSKPKDQAEGWSVYAEGRDMIPIVKPAAHPQGTSVEVLDLFYNTPARKRFLKSEKTEFIHASEILKRIALAYPEITFTLSHNGKMVQRYHLSDEHRWLSAICGTFFAKQSFPVTLVREELSLQGWICPSRETIHYFYVNGRVVKDKVTQHAMKRAISDHPLFQAQSDMTLNYVLYLTLPPQNVDVNVHPAKHEVRFHDARTVHDFVYHAVVTALNEAWTAKSSSIEPAIPSASMPTSSEPSPIHSVTADPQKRKTVAQPSHQKTPTSKQIREYQSIYGTMQPPTNDRHSLFQPFTSMTKTVQLSEQNLNDVTHSLILGRLCAVIDRQFALIEKRISFDDGAKNRSQKQFYLLSLEALQRVIFQIRLELSPIESCPLLLPIGLTLTEAERTVLEHSQTVLRQQGFQFESKMRHLSLLAVPKLLRHLPWQDQFIQLLKKLQANNNEEDLSREIVDFFKNVHQETIAQQVMDEQEIRQKIAELEQMDPMIAQTYYREEMLIQAVDMQALTTQFKIL